MIVAMSGMHRNIMYDFVFVALRFWVSWVLALLCFLEGPVQQSIGTRRAQLARFCALCRSFPEACQLHQWNYAQTCFMYIKLYIYINIVLALRKACKHSFAVAAQLMTDELVQDAHILVTVTKSYWHAHGLVGQSKKQPSQHASWARHQALGEWCSEVRTSP